MLKEKIYMARLLREMGGKIGKDEPEEHFGSKSEHTKKFQF